MNHENHHTKKTGKRKEGFFRRLRRGIARHPVSPLLYVTVLAVAIGYIVFNDMYTQAYVVSVDGQELGVVASAEEVDAMVNSLETRVASILGEDYHYDAEITVTAAYTPAGSFSDTGAMEDSLFNEVGALMEACAISVNGVEYGYAASEADMRALLDRISAPYLTENTVDYGFVEDVQIYPVELPANTEFDLEPIYAALTVFSVEDAYYTVQSGDTFNAIAYSLDMTPAELSALNMDVNINKLMVGQQLKIVQAVPFLSVINYTNETYEEPIPSPVEYIETADLYVGSTKVKEEGTDGLALVNANATYINGAEVAREVVTSKTLEEPTVTYMYTGTTPRPKTASNGYYTWPLAVKGTVTSKYGYRYIFGSYSWHSGLDLGAARGTYIRAADGGKVTHAGWKGSYGYLVIVTHDDGSQTYYAHCSKLLVKKGDKVYQGQNIAKVGSTGNSTGPHLHFEIRINGKTVDPQKYIKWGR